MYPYTTLAVLYAFIIFVVSTDSCFPLMRFPYIFPRIRVNILPETGFFLWSAYFWKLALCLSTNHSNHSIDQSVFLPSLFFLFYFLYNEKIFFKTMSLSTEKLWQHSLGQWTFCKTHIVSSLVVLTAISVYGIVELESCGCLEMLMMVASLF